MTFTRALQIRRLATSLPLSDIVLETDGPDIAPAWFIKHKRNEPAQIGGIAQTLAALRGCDRAIVLEQTTAAALRVLPKLKGLWDI